MRLQTVLILSAASALISSAALAQPQDSMAPNAASPTSQKAGRPHGRFARMDQDGDGKVTLQEFVAFNDQLFDRIDATHSGRITKADMDAFMTRRQAEEAGREMRAKGAGGAGGGGAGEKMLTKISDRLADGNAVTKQQWEAMSTRRFQRMDAAHLGYLTPETMQHGSKDAEPNG